MKKFAMIMAAFAVFAVCSTTVHAVDMVLIPGGEFDMGDHHDGLSYALPVHTVYVDSFYISKYAVTNQQYCDYLNDANSEGLIEISGGIVYPNGGGDAYCDTTMSSSGSGITWNGSSFGVVTGKESHPMLRVSWYGAVAYCDYYGYRLPTEAEREYAGRGGEYSPYFRYPCGDDLDSNQANYLSSGDPYDNGTTPIGFYNGQLHYKTDFNWPGTQENYQTADGSNNYSLYDMAGNVWEWCNDWYSSTYYQECYDIGTVYNPIGPASGSYRILRGGSCLSIKLNCRVANRHMSLIPASRNNYSGFRVASIPEPVIEAIVDIDPDTLNLKSKGRWITCYIWLLEEYDVADIDSYSVLLEDEIEPEWIWLDEEEQFVMAKFSRSEVQDILEPGEVELTVSGELLDGTKFEGSDMIRVIDKGGKK